jgi:hypothetical protein
MIMETMAMSKLKVCVSVSMNVPLKYSIVSDNLEG